MLLPVYICSYFDFDVFSRFNDFQHHFIKCAIELDGVSLPSD